MTIDIQRGIYSDEYGIELWRDDPYPMSRGDAVGDYMVRESVGYTVRGVAYHAGTMYVNLKRERMIAGIVIDDWKLSIFERHLSAAGYNYTTGSGVTEDTLLLKVKTENMKALEVVVRAANDEAARTRKPGAPEEKR